MIAISFEQKLILIGGTAYAGENKKGVFTVLNYLLPEQGVMPMHCSANHARGDEGDVAVFFGLSGTGKTTLSADPERILIGDDEHGWSDDGVFNFEGGCYAKTINLSPKAEPEIYKTTSMFGTVVENMVYDPQTRVLDFADDSLTANTRCAYPLEAISNASPTARGGQPKNIVMLTCDAFGVLPPIARLTPEQAMYHFLSGFTSKVAGTERGVTEPTPTFSTCFGAPFMPRRPEAYGALLGDRIAKAEVSCWLVNTGWTGGAYGEGSRMPIAATRALLTAALNGSLNGVAFRTDPVFGFEVPVDVPGVDAKLLDPRSTWADPAAYDAQAKKLAGMFAENFAQYEDHVSDAVKAVGDQGLTVRGRSPAPPPRPRRSGSAPAPLRRRGRRRRVTAAPTAPAPRSPAVEGEQPAADRYARGRCAAADRHRRPRHRLAQALGDRRGAGGRDVGEDGEELLAADAAEQVAAAAVRRHARRHLLQHDVADGVAVAVVDRLEAVDVDHDEGDAAAGGGGALDEGRGPREHRRARRGRRSGRRSSPGARGRCRSRPAPRSAGRSGRRSGGARSRP